MSDGKPFSISSLMASIEKNSTLLTAIDQIEAGAIEKAKLQGQDSETALSIVSDIEEVSMRDMGRALVMAVRIHNAAPDNSPAQHQAEQTWARLLHDAEPDQWSDLFTPVKTCFDIVEKQGFKDDIAHNVVALSAYHCLTDDRVREARAALAAVQMFAAENEDLALMNDAGKKVSLMRDVAPAQAQTIR